MPLLHEELRRRIGEWPPPNLPTPWREGLRNVAPNFDAVPCDVELSANAQILPLCGERSSIFRALEGIVPSEVSVVVIGNDPYPDPCRATGRSFEQGDLTNWVDDLNVPGRVTPSLLNLVCAIAALQPGAEGYQLDCDSFDPRCRAEKLRSALMDEPVALQPPQSMFEYLTGQGVLWLNRTLTIGMSCRRTEKRTTKSQQKWHRKLWDPVTRRIVTLLVEEVQARAIVFALFGGKAKSLKSWIEEGTSNVRVVEAAHPSAWRPDRRRFFSDGNPLTQVNEQLIGCNPIDWKGPANNTNAQSSARACSAQSAAIIDRTVGKYWTTLQRLADR